MADLLSDFLILVKREAITSTSTCTTISRNIASHEGSHTGVMLIDLDPEFPSIAVCCSGVKSNNYGALWKSALDFEMIKYQMVEAAGLLMNEKDVIEGKKDYLNFARYFAKSLICKNAISFSLSDDKQSLQLHLSYDFGSYKAPGTLLLGLVQDQLNITVVDMMRGLVGADMTGTDPIQEAQHSSPSILDTSPKTTEELSPPRKCIRVEEIQLSIASESGGRKKVKGAFSNNVARGGGVSLLPSRRIGR